jgi:hypothetical protein
LLRAIRLLLLLRVLWRRLFFALASGKDSKNQD